MRDELSYEARRALRARRDRRRKMVRRRRVVALGILILVAAAISSTVAALAGGTSQPQRMAAAVRHAKKPAKSAFPARPKEIRGVHVSMGLASLPGKIDQYLAMRRQGLNTLELDVKDETGQV